MQFNQNQAEFIVKAFNGAKVGDKIIFFSHVHRNKEMQGYMLANGVTLDKVYVVSSVIDDDAFFKDDYNNLVDWGNNHRIGHMDIIYSAPEQESKQFQPVTITLENQDEINLMMALLGALNPSIKEKFNNVITTPTYVKLNDIASKGIVNLGIVVE